jgi:hypothetical protein
MEHRFSFVCKIDGVNDSGRIILKSPHAEYYIHPKSLDQFIWFMELKKTQRDIVATLLGKRGEKDATLVKIKVLTEKDAEKARLIKAAKTERIKRLSEEQRLEEQQSITQMGADCLHRNHITKAAGRAHVGRRLGSKPKGKK